MVYFHHFNPFKYSGGFLKDFVNEFHVGVTFFFVLSGFLITLRYYDNFSNFKEYLINRFCRIYPMYFLITTAIFLLHAINIPSLQVYLMNITFLRGFFDRLKFTMIGPGWSLTVEECFYLMAPMFFFLILKSRQWLYSIPAILIVTGILLVGIFKNLNFYGLMGSLEFMFNYTFFGRCIEFATGIALALQFRNSTNAGSRYRTFGGIIVIIGLLSVMALIKSHFNVKVSLYHPFGIIVNNLLLPVLGIRLFYSGLLYEDTVVSRILKSDLFMLLGKSSYIFYLIHTGALSDFLRTQFYSLHFNWYFVSPVVFILLNIIAILLFRFVEDPLNHYLKKRLHGVGSTIPA
jgi:peptidoglycan/LPS O-acetylase OafA/YrhL